MNEKIGPWYPRINVLLREYKKTGKHACQKELPIEVMGPLRDIAPHILCPCTEGCAAEVRKEMSQRQRFRQPDLIIVDDIYHDLVSPEARKKLMVWFK